MNRLHLIPLLLVLATACHHAKPTPLYREGLLTGAADAVVARSQRLHCDGYTWSPHLGRLNGCYERSGDSVSFFGVNQAGDVVVVGSEWQLSETDALRKFTTLDSIMTGQHGPPQACVNSDSGWTVRDRRWMLGGYHIALILDIPKAHPGILSSLRAVRTLGPPDCSEAYPVPFAK